MTHRWKIAPKMMLVASAFLYAPVAAGRVAAQVPPPTATAALHMRAVRQPIYGFGGSQTYNGDALADFSSREEVYQALFQDLKIDIFRLRDYNGYPGEQDKFECLTREFAGGVRKWGNDPKTRGGKAPVRLMFTSWSPPPSLKSNGLASGRSDGTDKGLPDATLRRDAQGRFEYGPFADW